MSQELDKQGAAPTGSRSPETPEAAKKLSTAELRPADHFDQETHLDVDGKAVKRVISFGDGYTVVLYEGTGVVSLYEGGTLRTDVSLDFTDEVMTTVNVSGKSFLEFLGDCHFKNDDRFLCLYRMMKKMGIDLKYETQVKNILSGQLGRKFKKNGSVTAKRLVAEKWYLDVEDVENNKDFELTKFFGMRSDSYMTPGGTLVSAKWNSLDLGVSFTVTRDEHGRMLPPAEWTTYTYKDREAYQEGKSEIPAEARNMFDRNGGQERLAKTLSGASFGLECDNGQITFSSRQVEGKTMSLSCRNDVFHQHPQRSHLVYVLSGTQTITEVDTSRGVDPRRWVARSISLPDDVQRFRLGPRGNFAVYVVGNTLKVFNLKTAQVEHEFADLQGEYDIDQQGNILVAQQGRPRMIQTNFTSIVSEDERARQQAEERALAELLGGDFDFFADDDADLAPAEPVVRAPAVPESPYKVLQDKVLADLKPVIAAAGNAKDIEVCRAKLANAQRRIEIRMQKLPNAVHIAEEAVQLAAEAIAVRDDELVIATIYKRAATMRAEVDKLGNLDAVIERERELKLMLRGLIGIHPDRHDAVKDRQVEELQAALQEKLEEYLRAGNDALFATIAKERDAVYALIGEIPSLKALAEWQDSNPEYMSLLEFVRSPDVAARIPTGHEVSQAKIRAGAVERLMHKKADLGREAELKGAREREALETRLDEITQAIALFLELADLVQDLDLQTLRTKPAYRDIESDIDGLPEPHKERMRLYLEGQLQARRRAVNKEFAAFRGELSFMRNDPDLYFDESRVKQRQVNWRLATEERDGNIILGFRNNEGREVKPTLDHQLQSGDAYCVSRAEYAQFRTHFQRYVRMTEAELLDLRRQTSEKAAEFHKPVDKGQKTPQLEELERKALHVASAFRKMGFLTRPRRRNVPQLDEGYVYTDQVIQDLKKAAVFLKMQLKSGKGMLLLEGDTGTGKDFLLDIILAETNRELFNFDCSKWTDTSDATYSFEFDGKTIKVPSAVIQALETPGACLYFNEFNTLSSDMIKFFNALLSHRRSVTTTDGRMVTAHPSVIIVGSMNARQGYKGVRALSPDAKGRIDYLEVDYPKEKMTAAQMTRRPEQRNLTVPMIAKDILGVRKPKPTAEAVAIAEGLAVSILSLVMIPKPETADEKDILRTDVIGAVDGNRGGAGNLYSPDEASRVYRNVEILRDFSLAEFKDLWHVVVNQQAAREQKVRDAQSSPDAFKRIEVAVLSILMFVKAANIAREKFRQSQSGEINEVLDFIMSTREIDRCATLLDLVV